MTEAPNHFDPTTLAKIAGLRLRAQHIVEGYVAGLHRSPYHGFSIEFAEHREYAPGDDLRHVDWKVFGRTDKFYLKQYEDETNLLAYLMLDTSESMTYKSDRATLTKLEYAQCIAASLAWLVLQQQDAVGAATFDDQVRLVVRPGSGATQLNQVVALLDSPAGTRKTNLAPVFHELAERFTKRGVVVLLSDLFGDVAGLLNGLKHFKHRRHDLIVLHVLDPAELDFPFQGQTMFEGLEEYPSVLTDPWSLRSAYLEEFHKFTEEVRIGCRTQQIDYLTVRTDQPLDVVLSSYLAGRAARMK